VGGIIDKVEQYIPTSFDINAKELKDKGVAPAPEDFNVVIESPTGAVVPVDIKVTLHSSFAKATHH